VNTHANAAKEIHVTFSLRPTAVVAVLIVAIGCQATTSPSIRPSPSEPSAVTSPPARSATAAPARSVAAATPAAIGSSGPKPAPAALARNGAIVYSDAVGDIHSLDPETGKTTLLIGGPTNDHGPGFLRDGTRFLFVRVDNDGDVLYSANADGSDVQKFADAKQMANFEYSPRGDQIASVHGAGGNPEITDLASGSRRVISLGKPVNIVSWLTDDSLLVAYLNEQAPAVEMWTINVDGTNQQAITAPSLCCGVSTLPGRGLIAWTSWSSGGEGRVHILDTATGKDTLIASTDVPGSHFLEPIWSPDGKWLTARQFTANVDGVQLALLASDGSGPAIALGPKLPTNGGQIRSTFSPDGTKLLVTYEDGSAWLFALPAGTGGKTDWSGLVETTWQALYATP